jgi:hypothetical protein
MPLTETAWTDLPPIRRKLHSSLHRDPANRAPYPRWPPPMAPALSSEGGHFRVSLREGAFTPA